MEENRNWAFRMQRDFDYPGHQNKMGVFEWYSHRMKEVIRVASAVENAAKEAAKLKGRR